MNYISPSYPLHQSDELFFQISSSPLQQHKIQQDFLHVIPPSLASLDLPIKLDKTLDQKPDDGRCNEDKKTIHREIERQRRKEMTTLYASLRSLLPLKYLKGKRAISDHIDEAANYITYLQKNIQELSDKREKLKRLSNSSTPVTVIGTLRPSECVTVQPSCIGVEVVISSNLRDGVAMMPLSRVLELLVEDGLGVVSCVSTKVNERLFHTIQSEASNPESVDASVLQQKLMDLIQSATLAGL